MKRLNIFAILLSILLFVSCGKETPFSGDMESGEGSFSKSALEIEVRDVEMTSSKAATRAEAEEDYTVTFTKVGSETAEAIYTYGDMPEIVTLPVGKYTVSVSFGNDVDAGWDSPYYVGTSEEFSIRENEITTDIDTIICRLQNVKVSVYFDEELTANMMTDSYVEVKVGDNEGLTYKKSNENEAGYFHHETGVSLVAVFHGTVEGLETVETKSYDNVQKGYHYKLTFRLHKLNGGGSSTGSVDGDLSVDATVTVLNLDNNIPVAEDEDLGDSERPKEDLGGQGSTATGSDPVVTMIQPTDLVFDQEYLVKDTDIENGISLKVVSHPGISEMTIDIISEQLSPEELEGVGLNSHLDLVNPGEYAESLESLGFAVNVGGKEELTFSIPANLMMMLNAVGAGNTHTFRITVTNEYQGEGESTPSKHTVVKNLILKLN